MARNSKRFLASTKERDKVMTLIQFVAGRDGRPIARAKGKIILPARGFEPPLGSTWDCSLEERDKYFIARPIKIVAEWSHDYQCWRSGSAKIPFTSKKLKAIDIDGNLIKRTFLFTNAPLSLVREDWELRVIEAPEDLDSEEGLSASQREVIINYLSREKWEREAYKQRYEAEVKSLWDEVKRLKEDHEVVEVDDFTWEEMMDSDWGRHKADPGVTLAITPKLPFQPISFKDHVGSFSDWLDVEEAFGDVRTSKEYAQRALAFFAAHKKVIIKLSEKAREKYRELRTSRGLWGATHEDATWEYYKKR